MEPLPGSIHLHVPSQGHPVKLPCISYCEVVERTLLKQEQTPPTAAFLFYFFRFLLLFGFGVLSTSAAAAIADNVAEGEGGSVVKRPEGCDLGEPGGRPSAVLLVVLDIMIMRAQLCSLSFVPLYSTPSLLSR